MQCFPAAVRAAQIELPGGKTLLDAVAAVLAERGASSAVGSLHGGSLSPMAFFLPAASASPAHAVSFSERFDAAGPARLESGCITVGQRDGRPWLHCHAIWTDPEGRRRCGHVAPECSRIDEPLRLSAWLMAGADFVVGADAETNFSIFQATAAPEAPAWPNALVVRLRPNEDLCAALERVCAGHGIRHARVRGGVGSLVGAVFDDGRTVGPVPAEVFIRSGTIAPGPAGLPQAMVEAGMVDDTGHLAEGRLARGRNPVLVTFEVVLEVTPPAWRQLHEAGAP